MLWRMTTITFCALCCYIGPAHAQADDATSKKVRTPNHIEFGAGLFGFANGNFIEQPKGTDLDLRPYPGFAGAGGGGGIALNALWRGIVGIELQIMHSVENAKGGMDFPSFSVDANIEQTSLHVPLLLKIEAPTKSVRPFLVVGPDFVTPGETEMKSQSVNLFARSESYTALAFGFGLEFRLNLEESDIRIPFAVRGNYNSDIPEKSSERVEIGSSSVGPSYTYRGEWQWQAFVTLGVSYHFKSEI